MKILFVSDSYYPHVNGVYYFVSRIGKLLMERGHDVAVIAPSGNMHSYKKKIDRLDVYGLASVPVPTYSTVRIPFPIILKRQIRQEITSFKPDIIHIQDHFMICNAVVHASIEFSIPVIATNHMMPENFTAFLRWGYIKKKFEGFLWKGLSDVFKRASIVTTPSEAGVELIRSKVKPDVIAISNGVNLEEFSQSGNAGAIKEKYGIPDKPILLYVGRLDPEKHIEDILESVAAALKSIDFTFLIVGKGTRKDKLEHLSRQLHISDKVIFTGFVPDEELPYIYKTGRCFIIASTAELLSLVTLQAISSGLPVIAVNAGALTQLVHDRINGFLFTPGDIHQITRDIQEILIDDDLQRKMGEKSLQIAQLHDINAIVRSFERIYYQASGKKETYNTTSTPAFFGSSGKHGGWQK
jgi:glycosyltransferase involved in cell wall biosynthesis